MCVTGRGSREENHAVSFRQSAENCSPAWNTQPIRSSLMSLQGGASVGTPWPQKKIWKEVPSLSICPSIHLLHTTETLTLSRIKCERYIFIKKCVSFVH